MVADEKISLHESEDAKLIFELDNRKRVLCAAPGTNGILFTGGEDRNVTAWDAASGKVAYCIEDAHATRVKGIVVLSTSSDTYTVASASSVGVIHIWDVRGVNKEKTTLLAEANTRSRLNCLAGSSIKYSKIQARHKSMAIIFRIMMSNCYCNN
ncbi:p21-activated kinase-interacting 1-like [Olea europaea subsp. europaea]|uniref:p21-activated kinase-interacting 1-like n=1 Tax=Olea europaea subsp. europaea TaxID=158383 RepID=A0A8S0UAN6_OLEEU|nr:p21-activated kinase-interacting 1-like [Olea europaea subsp. europaea]